MSFLAKFHRWLKGLFICQNCGRTFQVMCLGFGEAICPECYDGEPYVLLLDKSYFLNRMMIHLIHPKRLEPKPSSKDNASVDLTSHPLEVKVKN